VVHSAFSRERAKWHIRCCAMKAQKRKAASYYRASHPEIFRIDSLVAVVELHRHIYNIARSNCRSESANEY
jgi:hypothetical protein